MARVPQKRRLATRVRLVRAAKALVAQNGYNALRVDDVVREAGVAKGTLFAHFEDKDRLLALLIGEEMEEILAGIAAAATPATIEELCDALDPLLGFMSRDRVVFDVVLRHSGGIEAAEGSEITRNFSQQIELLSRWLAEMQTRVIRSDVRPELLAEGVQAFAVNAVVLKFCSIHSAVKINDRLREYLRAWLLPGISGGRDHTSNADQQDPGNLICAP